MSVRPRPPALLLALAFAAGVLGACDGGSKNASAPPPQEPGPESVAHFCGMSVADHPGPKGQIFLEGEQEPIWFASVRDALAFTMLPEEPKTIAAIYVNDMAKAQDWEHPEPGSWVEAREAVYVVGSAARGGMGAEEAVPFSDRAAAERFRAERGGTIVGFAEVPRDYVLGGGDAPDAQLSERVAPGDAAKGDRDDHH